MTDIQKQDLCNLAALITLVHIEECRSNADKQECVSLFHSYWKELYNSSIDSLQYQITTERGEARAAEILDGYRRGRHGMLEGFICGIAYRMERNSNDSIKKEYKRLEILEANLTMRSGKLNTSIGCLTNPLTRRILQAFRKEIKNAE